MSIESGFKEGICTPWTSIWLKIFMMFLRKLSSTPVFRIFRFIERKESKVVTTVKLKTIINLDSLSK